MKTKKLKNINRAGEFAEFIPKITEQLGGPLVPSLLGLIAEYLESGRDGTPDNQLYEDACGACGILVNIFGDLRYINYSDTNPDPPCQFMRPRYIPIPPLTTREKKPSLTQK